MELFATTPEEFAALIRRNYERLGKLIKDAGIKSDWRREITSSFSIRRPAT